MRMMYAFVYGTLKRGEPNHHWISNEGNGVAKFISEGVSVQKYPLVIASKYNIPFLLDKPGSGKNISGEVYEIDEKMLAHLDILEEYPKLYTRREEEITLKNGNESTVVKAMVYLLNNFQPVLLEKPFLSSYSSTGPDSLPYAARIVENEVPELHYDIPREAFVRFAEDIAMEFRCLGRN